MSHVVRREMVGGVSPWRASGPGWVNAGVTAIMREISFKDGKLDTREFPVTLYARDNPVVAEWLDVAIIATDKLKREIEKGDM